MQMARARRRAAPALSSDICIFRQPPSALTTRQENQPRTVPPSTYCTGTVGFSSSATAVEAKSRGAEGGEGGGSPEELPPWAMAAAAAPALVEEGYTVSLKIKEAPEGLRGYRLYLVDTVPDTRPRTKCDVTVRARPAAPRRGCPLIAPWAARGRSRSNRPKMSRTAIRTR